MGGARFVAEHYYSPRVAPHASPCALVSDGRFSSVGKTEPKWVKKAELVDSRDSVHDIKFAPHHKGLKLATASADGIVRIYEATDVMNLTQWQLQSQFEGCHLGVTCLSWCQSQFAPEMLAVGGSAQDSEHKVFAKVCDLAAPTTLLTDCIAFRHGSTITTSESGSLQQTLAKTKTCRISRRRTGPMSTPKCMTLAGRQTSDGHTI
jgi:WD40 repeat protein